METMQTGACASSGVSMEVWLALISAGTTVALALLGVQLRSSGKLERAVVPGSAAPTEYTAQTVPTLAYVLKDVINTELAKREPVQPASVREAIDRADPLTPAPG